MTVQVRNKGGVIWRHLRIEPCRELVTLASIIGGTFICSIPLNCLCELVPCVLLVSFFFGICS